LSEPYIVDVIVSVDGEDILNQLREADETTLRFSSWGFGGRLEPSASAAFLSHLLGHATLVDDVPEDVRLGFERVRAVFLHGLLDYDLFTAAYFLGHLVLEGALRARFISFYDGGIPVLRNGVEDALAVSTFADYHEALNAARRRREKLRLRATPDEGMPRGYPDLYQWARRRELLIGQRNVGVFGSIVRLRNYVAHPEGHMVDAPPSVYRFLCDVAEIINRLWGHDTDGGRLFPRPIARWARAAALDPDRQAAVTFGSLAQIRTESTRRDWTYAVFLAAADEELVDFDFEAPGHQRFAHVRGFQMTNYPVEMLWGPGSWKDLVQAVDELSDEAPVDRVKFLDRTFYVRVTQDGRIEYPRDRSDVLAADLTEESAVWYVLRADFPADAFVAVRDHLPSPTPTFSTTTLITRVTSDAAARRHARA
jgi:hypothetical protein